MKLLGYIPLIAAILLGWHSMHPALVILCAAASTLIFMSARRAQVKHKNYTGGTNMLVDGAYLITIQALIMFAAYLLGWLTIRILPTLMEWLHIS